jgi:starch synthase
MLALGIHYADVVTTVSPTYAEEILSPEQGFGLDPLLRARRSRLFGVLNGIDTVAFDPSTDPEIRPHYDRESLEGKRLVKSALQREVGLPGRQDIPLFGFVGRLTDQKGVDLLVPALDDLLDEQPFQLVVLGTGEPRYHELLKQLARRAPDQVVAILKFDAALAQRMYAGCDFFLMPSRFEPCGLGQMIALRYGTVPIVRSTGGLGDTVHDWDQRRGLGNGFVFEAYRPGALLVALARGLEVYRNPMSWKTIRRNGMAADHSWRTAADRYVELYALTRGALERS